MCILGRALGSLQPLRLGSLNEGPHWQRWQRDRGRETPCQLFLAAAPLTLGCLPGGNPHEDRTETVYTGPSIGPAIGQVPTTPLWNE